MSDVVGYFQILNWERCEVLPFTADSAGNLANGFMAKINSDGTLTVSGAGDIPDGVAYTNRTLVYAPTTIYAQTGEPVSLVRGLVEFLADNNAFVGGTLPTFNQYLYSGAGGRFSTTGSSIDQLVGRCLSTSPDVRQAPNQTSGLVLCEARFGAK